jgi:hypothetical protein
MTKEHIIYTLGINVPTLTESLNKNKNSLQLILEEQMLYESFIDSIKTYAKDKWDKTISTITDWKDVAVAVGKSITSNKIPELTNAAYRYGIKNPLNTLKSILDKIKLSKLYEDYVLPFIKKIGSIEGWKGFLLTLGIGSIITYITTQLSKLSAETMTQWIYKYFSGQAIADITSKFINFTSFVGWLQPIIKGTKIIFDILKPSISKLNTTYSVSPKPSITELISSKSLNIYNKNKTMKNEQLKKLIKEEIKNLLESTPAIEGQAVLLPLMKQLGIDGQKFTLAFNSIKQNKELNLQMKTILSDTMIALIKSNDDTLLQKIFIQLKKIGTTPVAASAGTNTPPAPAPVK